MSVPLHSGLRTPMKRTPALKRRELFPTPSSNSSDSDYSIFDGSDSESVPHCETPDFKIGALRREGAPSDWLCTAPSAAFMQSFTTPRQRKCIEVDTSVNHFTPNKGTPLQLICPKKVTVTSWASKAANLIPIADPMHQWSCCEDTTPHFNTVDCTPYLLHARDIKAGKTEVRALIACIDSPHVVRYHDCWEEINKVGEKLIIQTAAPNVGLVKSISPSDKAHSVAKLAVEIGSALELLHDSGFAHGWVCLNSCFAHKEREHALSYVYQLGNFARAVDLSTLAEDERQRVIRKDWSNFAGMVFMLFGGQCGELESLLDDALGLQQAFVKAGVPKGVTQTVLAGLELSAASDGDEASSCTAWDYSTDIETALLEEIESLRLETGHHSSPFMLSPKDE